MVEYTKPWLSIHAQVAQLRNRGLTVDDEAVALRLLAGEDPGRGFDYVVTFASTSRLSKVRAEPVELVVKATDAPPPPVRTLPSA